MEWSYEQERLDALGQYSYAGSKAKTADLEALDQAEELERRNVDPETIRQQTGWFRGKDGKWRFEVDDSGMQYHRSGDAMFSEMHPEYARQIAACEAEIAEFQRQYDEITGGMTAYEQYEKTAGEIEARDTASRRDLTAEERKKTPPRLGDENTVFVEKTGISLEQELSDYPYDMQTVILDYIDSVNSEVLEFVDDVETGASWKGKKVSIGTADERMINDIWKITKTKVDPASEILISSSTIEHILKRHGKHGKVDRSLSDNRDIARIPYILRNYDHAEDGKNPTKAYKNKDGSPAKTVVFSKKINGTFYVVEAITDNGKIWVLSAYINKKGTSQVRDADAPRRTANTEFASVPSNIISNAEDDVKRQFSISPAEDQQERQETQAEPAAASQNPEQAPERTAYTD